jgi:starch-binding outer membrane protein, SusD/RagB family
MKNIKYIAAIVLIVLLFVKCSKDYLDEKPPNIITAESLYKDLEGFEIGLNGLYALVRMERQGRESVASDGSLNYNLNITNDAIRTEVFMNGTDAICVNHNAGTEWSETCEDMANLVVPTNYDIESNFLWLYRIINTANTIIGRAGQDDVEWFGGSATPKENKNRVIGDARAIRAWAYRHLTYGWGDVPLSLEESNGSNIKTDWVRTPVNKVREQMKADLLFAEKNIGADVVAGRISQGAIRTYLAELYIVLEKYDSAIYYANACINSGDYKLVTSRFGEHTGEEGTPFSDMFKSGNSNRSSGNTETLWTWQWDPYAVGGGGSNMRRYIISRYEYISTRGVTALELTDERGGRGRTRMASTKYQIELYEPQDYRFANSIFRRFYILKDASQNAPYAADELPSGYSYGDTIFCKWTYPLTIDGMDLPGNDRYDWPFSRKFEGADPLAVSGNLQYEDQIYLRLAETYLLLAEAQHLSGDNPGAATTINVIRQRANASLINAGDIDMDFILDERARELLFEEHRRHTLVRTGTWYDRTKAYNLNGGQNIATRNKLLPIPQTVIDGNLSAVMPQNEGY